MQYNVDFLIAGWIVSLCVAFHILVSKHNFRGILPRLVYLMVVDVWLDCTFDIAASFCISTAADQPLFLLYTTDIVLYLVQSAMTVIIFAYSVGLCGELRPENRRILHLASVPFFALCLLILTTPLHGLVFSFDPVTHAYSYGFLIPAVYIVSAFYGFAVAALFFRYVRFLRRIDIWAIGFSCTATVATVIYQAILPHVPIAGLVASVCLFFIYVTLCDSTGLGDTDTGVFAADEFRRRIAAHITHEVNFDIVFVSFTNRRYLNEIAGVAVVDRLLSEVAAKFMRATPSRQVYRLFGSHFAALSYDRETTKRIVDEMNRWLGGDHQIGSQQLRLTTKVSWIYDAMNAVRDVDLQAYADYVVNGTDVADAQGGAPMLDGSQVMEGFIAKRKAMLALENALAEDALDLVLQPIYSPSEGRFSELEVLSRLDDATGMISPSRFIPLAEETGLITEVSRQQFDRLCAYLRDNVEELTRLGVCHVKFNISAVELANANLGKILLETIDENGLDPRLFCFEVTETAASKGRESLDRVFADLRERGCSIFLDDFGSGYANLVTVMNLPIDGVKLDISLLRSAEAEEPLWSFYIQLVEIMHSLGKVVVSEGVETKESAERLVAEQVDLLQGYYYARPLAPEALVPFLRRKNGAGEGSEREG